MTAYIFKRVLAVIPILIFVGIATFSLVHIAPGDAANIMAGDYAGPDDVKLIRAELGLDKPVTTQFWEWAGRTLRGDLGKSIYSGRTVAELVGQRLEPTIALTIAGGTLAVLLGIPMGVFAAWRAGSRWDRGIQIFAALGISVPGFWLGFILILAFAVYLRWFPVIGYVSVTEDLFGWLKSITLPVSLLAISGSSVIIRMTRGSILEVLREDYIRTARAKGLANKPVLFRHALRAGAIPIITVIGTLAGALITGVVVTETVFTIPGLGRLVAETVQNRDFPVVQSMLMLLASFYVFINLMVDLAYVFFDPRVRL
ncbi:MAG: ABC transporter permease [SAR202 cluster bacterium]|mgnify:FL=1|nr:MAG: ABC transporter permease [SAR202 cluster bacterium]MBI01853.1 peptide ABC transporter [Chloroflexota bacterium]MQG89311.1 ABC transporter permease [SAR202 cluster bacterium]